MAFDSSYRISNYGRKAPFSSFLPGVAGERGIPLWCFYVNRGQAIAGFGSRDKHRSIMEFCPANTAYQRVQTVGFRTFIKVNGMLIEPFIDGRGDMLIDENRLTIEWTSPDHTLGVEVRYFIVPNTGLGTLARRVLIKNLTKKAMTVEVLDGLSAIVPYGLEQHPLKMMGQTAKAWMMVEGLEKRLPYFRLRASLVDTTSVEPIEDGSYGAACSDGTRLPVIVDPAVVFGWDTSFASPVCFADQPLSSLLQAHQRTENELPCCFFALETTIEGKNNATVLNSIFGLSHGQESLALHADSLLAQEVLDRKEKEACDLLAPYTRVIDTHTADPLFDRYCRQSYIDNFLRGGVPTIYRSGDQKQLFYLYSRKHGDLERDYNEFVVTPEYASQGNGNFRDVLQNRRSDVRFCPDAGWEPLKPFLELIQADGYNPLVIEPVSFILKKNGEQWSRYPELSAILEGAFTPGMLLKALEKTNLSPDEQDRLFNEIMCSAEHQVNASFAEGYWIDHWIYLLDLLESYLSIYPEKRDSLLNDRCLRWYESRATVLPLCKRCVKAGSELRQFKALDYEKKAAVSHQWMLDGTGHEVQSTPLEKLFMLCVLKFASLDASGEAVSMEAGKPGWYDALNGLPGLFGSSTAESSELWRTLVFVQDAFTSPGISVQLPAEMAAFARKMAQIALIPSAYDRWAAATPLLEAYREQTAFGVGSEIIQLSCDEVLSIVKALLSCTSDAVEKLIDSTEGVVPTYFTNLPTQWHEADEGIHPTQFDHQPLPLFLEGTVHALRLPISAEKKQDLLTRVRSSSLWDDKLHMFKVSADLSKETPELGRANAFTRGWLEHESIWLHMEYKHLLEMLKNGFYDQFFEAFLDALIPFQPPERYGRSILENSSFLASSANPDPGTHGRGFVARLSGATAEFLEMWQIMFFGRKPFEMCSDVLTLSFKPTLPARLIPKDGVVSAVFLGRTEIVYHFPNVEYITPDTHSAVSYRLIDQKNDEVLIKSPVLTGQLASDVRDGKYKCIHVTF